MKKRAIFVLAASVAIFCVPAGFAADAMCLELREMIVGNTYVAKEPLYDTKIDNHGIIDLERDKQEIPVGAQFMVLKVGCESNKLEVKLREVAPKKKDAVKVNFKLSKAERQMSDAKEQFQQMMDYVWEDVPTE